MFQLHVMKLDVVNGVTCSFPTLHQHQENHEALLQCVYIHAAGYWIGMYVYQLIVNYVVQEYCVVVADKYKMSAESCWIRIYSK